MSKRIVLLLAVLFALPAAAQTKFLAKRAVAADTTAPEAFAITASAPTSSTCTLDWTAPHEDGASGGNVASYDCRVCTQATCSTTMDDGEYGSATTLSGEPTPSTAGSAQSPNFTASGLSASTAYVFGCKSQDEVPNVSAVSSGGTPTCTTSAPSGFCSGSFQFCDEFSGTLGNFSVVPSGDTWTIGSGVTTAPNPVAAGANTSFLVYSTLASGSTTEYVIAKLSDYVSGDQGIFIRGNSSSGSDKSYVVYYQGTNTFWSVVEYSTGNFNEDVGHCSLAFSDTDYIGVSVTGTSSSTVMKVWKYASASAPTAPPSDPPDCSWTAGTGAHTGAGSVCDVANCTPTVPANDGTALGLYVNGDVAGRKFDDFAGGGE